MSETYDIGDVARKTGLTQRTLRFYETRGLVAPVRTAGGRRLYGAGDLARLNAVVAFKRAGFSLARIAELLSGRRLDLAKLVAGQISHIDARAAALAESRSLLVSVQARLKRGEQIDVSTICAVLRANQTIMERTDWKPVVDNYFTSEQQKQCKATVPRMLGDEEYGARWKELGERIQAALPLDAASKMAQAFVDEWFALLRPFTDAATTEMWDGVARMYDDRTNWNVQPETGFSHEVWTFIRAATQAGLKDGRAIDVPQWVLDRTSLHDAARPSRTGSAAG